MKNQRRCDEIRLLTNASFGDIQQSREITPRVGEEEAGRVQDRGYKTRDARLREDDQVRELRSARSARGINAYAPAQQFVSTQAWENEDRTVAGTVKVRAPESGTARGVRRS